jgi:serine/threonine protein kinase
MADVTEKLERLAGLLEKGLITRAQFEDQRDALFLAKNAADPGSSNPDQNDAIGAYRILGELGRGGMGVVYRAKHRTAAIAKRQGGELALKVLHAQYAQNPLFQERFEREASMGLKLKHPGIVKVLDLVVAEGGRLAIAMDLAEGRALSEVIGKEMGPIPWEQAWPLFEQLLAAVGYAHTQGVVHRDLKPENVVVSADNQLKILDFGIAKDLEGGKTKTGTGMGTVDYMAPEQYLDAKRVDSRADIYALGMTLYEMLAGRLPWEKDTPEFTILEQKKNGRLPPPTQFYPAIPAGVVAVVERATAVKMEDRYPSVEALSAALKGASDASNEGETQSGTYRVKGVDLTKSVYRFSKPPPSKARRAKPTAPRPTAPKPTAPRPTAPRPTAPRPTAPRPAAPSAPSPPEILPENVQINPLLPGHWFGLFFYPGGRLSRSQFWLASLLWAIIISFFIVPAISVLDPVLHPPDFFLWGLFIPLLCISAKRCQDFDCPGSVCLLLPVLIRIFPITYPISIVILGFYKGTEGPNSFGVGGSFSAQK